MTEVPIFNSYPQADEVWLVRFKDAGALTMVRVVRVFGKSYQLRPKDGWSAEGIYERSKDFNFVEQVHD